MHQPQFVSYAHQLNTLRQQAKDLLTRVVSLLSCVVPALYCKYDGQVVTGC